MTIKFQYVPSRYEIVICKTDDATYIQEYVTQMNGVHLPKKGLVTHVL